ncbi:uncharacterized protein LOC119080754 [Bradysia coprophila]|uniref:uncharacterized protein LOC119080754 n=1 Tax=Bradysia coprophila TaxID=38358 RepID=UPI00187DAAB8|nr:uncharacterized protein LOC119080754 [Bradysia coprophila]
MASKTEYEIDSQIAEGMEGLLSEAVRKHPVLYAKPSNIRFKSMRSEKEPDAWNQISDELNLEVESCKSLWSCIKQKFIKYRKKLDNGETFTKEWPTYENLHEWLDEHIKKRRTRNDIYKQIRVPVKQGKMLAVTKRSPNSSVCENEYLDDIESAEWNELADEKDEAAAKEQISKQQLLIPKTPVVPKKKLKIEIIQAIRNTPADKRRSENDEEIFTEIETPEEPAETTVECGDKQTDTVEILNKVEQNDTIDSNRSRDIILEANFDKLEQVIAKCVNLAEKCMAEYSQQDSNEVFGKFVASLVRDLPPERRMKVQFEIIQFTGQLVKRELNK